MESRLLFVTGKLAEPALRRVVADLASQIGFAYEIAVLPITVAALLTTDWIHRHLSIPENITRVILPGYTRGELSVFSHREQLIVEKGPRDLRDLPEFFGKGKRTPEDYGAYDIEILAEINHASSLSREELLTRATRYRADGADIIDLGCDPGPPWEGIDKAIRELKATGFRVSIDSFHPDEVSAAIEAGAERVLSVNRSNVHLVPRWLAACPSIEVVAIPDTPTDQDSLDETIRTLKQIGIRFFVDPILEPIGFGFARSLGRYLNVRDRYPDIEMMMGIGNLTELTDADSAAINVMLAGFCQEVGIRSVLTTEVINWARSSVREFALARRLVHHAVRHRVLPKHLEPDLVLLRDPRIYELGSEGLAELASRVTDSNYRLFAERGEIHVINGSMYLHGTDPFTLFAEMQARDSRLDPSHAFYLGYEMAKAMTALTLGKNYTQDQALRWGFLTIPEVPHR